MEQQEEEITGLSPFMAQMGNWRLDQEKGLLQGHPASPWGSQDHTQKGSTAGLRAVIKLSCKGSKPGVLGQL